MGRKKKRGALQTPTIKTDDISLMKIQFTMNLMEYFNVTSRNMTNDIYKSVAKGIKYVR